MLRIPTSIKILNGSKEIVSASWS